MSSVRMKDKGWEGDLILNLLIIGEGEDRKVWILTDYGKYKRPICELKVCFASAEFILPLFDPENNTIAFGQELEVHLPDGKDRRLLEKVTTIAWASTH